jgi:FkbM family methyltransferase
MELKTASGKIYNLDFEPINQLSKDRTSFVQVIVDQINSGLYDDSIEGGVVVDAGANVGLFSIYASTIAERVYAIEPTATHYQNMISIILALKITNIVPINMALWTHTGTVDFHLVDHNTTMNSITGHSQNTVLVPCLDLPTLFDQYGIATVNYLKCDIEGAEFGIIDHETFAQVSHRINNLYLETHLNPRAIESDELKQTMEQMRPFMHDKKFADMVGKIDTLFNGCASNVELSAADVERQLKKFFPIVIRKKNGEDNVIIARKQ